ncbi:hypothetical protein JCM10908_006379 [Rhodotorula pacifica]|uniref:uncharacterized protein n=1 Tax=Rhodotorula pacifica TaxID=1495444 RepID=UPI0031717776
MNGQYSEPSTPRVSTSTLSPSPFFPPASTSTSTSTPTRTSSSSATPTPSTLLQDQDLCIIGGGTGCNAVVGAFAGARTISYCLPVSDDGGSSSEIQRVLGGPALGDIRSRLIRLIPSSPSGSPLDCIRRLLEYRLPGGAATSHVAVKQEWGDIVEGTHRLWRGFNFKKASIGNLFLSGASLFLGSVPSAIFLFVSVTGISHDSIRIIPVINTSSTVTIAAELEDGQVIAGQSEISHPSTSATPSAAANVGAVAPSQGTAPLLLSQQTAANATTTTLRAEAIFPLTRATTPSFPEPPVLGAEEDESHAEIPPSPDLHLLDSSSSSSALMGAYSHEEGDHTAPLLSPSGIRPSQHLEFTKDASSIPPLPSRIQRIFYLSSYGLEIHPRPNSLFLHALQDATTLIYAPGSLYTSIVPCLALRPVGELIARGGSGGGGGVGARAGNEEGRTRRRRLRNKVLLLNSSEDRETTGYDAVDFVMALTDACRRSAGAGAGADAREVEGGGQIEPCEVVSHVVYVRNGHLRVDEDELRKLGITPVPVGPTPEGLFEDEVVRDALAQILAAGSTAEG